MTPAAAAEHAPKTKKHQNAPQLQQHGAKPFSVTPASPDRATHAATAPTPSIPWPAILREARTRFGIKGFRSGQRDVLEAVFAGHSVLGLMPTGAGKSLTYQLPALFLPRPVVVVSPLIALMQDQEEKAAAATSPSRSSTPPSPPARSAKPATRSTAAPPSSSTSPQSGSKPPSSSSR